MASKRFLYSIIFLCVLLIVIFLLIHRPQTSTKETNAPRHVSANSTSLSRRQQLLLGFKPRPDSHRVVIQVDKITKALWDSGFKIMSLILDRNLRSVIPYTDSDSGSDSGGRGGGTYKKNNNTITLYNGNKITIFAPRDEAISFKSWFRTHYQYHIVPMKVDKEDFAECVSLPSFFPLGHELIITEADEIHRVHNVRVTHWNIYNDNYVIVHGVDNNFTPWITIELFFSFCARKLVTPLMLKEE